MLEMLGHKQKMENMQGHMLIIEWFWSYATPLKQIAEQEMTQNAVKVIRDLTSL